MMNSIDKFRSNASRLLTENKIDRAVESIFGLDKIKDITELTSLLAL